MKIDIDFRKIADTATRKHISHRRDSAAKAQNSTVEMISDIVTKSLEEYHKQILPYLTNEPPPQES